jgi:uncharacterized membrane protein YfcA
MRRCFVRFSRPESFVHTRSSAGFTITTSGFEFSVHTAVIFAVVGTLGAFAGSSLGKLVDGNRLLFLFGLIMVAVGAMMLRPRRENAAAEREANLATCLLTAAVAFLAGIASGFFGIGGGFLIVPGLMLTARMPMIKAVGSSLLAVGSFGLATAINYSLSGPVDWRIAGCRTAKRR